MGDSRMEDAMTTALHWVDGADNMHRLYETDGKRRMIVVIVKVWPGGGRPRYWMRGLTGGNYVPLPETLRTIEEMKAWTLTVWRMR